MEILEVEKYKFLDKNKSYFVNLSNILMFSKIELSN